MSVAKTIEISATSPKSFEDAIAQGLAKANETVNNIQGAWISEQKVDVQDGKVSAFRVDMKVTFILT